MLVSAFVLILACVLVVDAQLERGGLTVTTAQGPVVGTLVSPTVRQFLGIPYGLANRWEAPKPSPKRAKPFRATEFSDTCPQALNPNALKFWHLFGLNDSTIFVPESEDCLTINIWAPSVVRKQRTAVLLWVYGGSFQFGTASATSYIIDFNLNGLQSNFPTYNGETFVQNNDDIILATFNYRMNIFGFPGAPQLVSETQPQNFGLLDLDAAVQWVYDNIASFGGDPERIVLFGQSAGSVAIDAYTFAHPQDTKVKGVIEQSGSLGVAGSISTLNPIFWSTVASAVGCGNVTDTAQLACMKQVPARKLEDVVIEIGIGFGPVVDNVTIFSDIATRSASGNFLRVPYLGGTAQHESDIFVVGAEELAGGVAIPNLTELLADLQTQILFTCLTGGTTNDRVKAGVPTWRYQYQGVFPDISSRPDLRAYHGAEIPVIFGTFDLRSNPAPTRTEIALSKFMQGAWVTFARNPVQGLVDYGWPRYLPNTTTLAQLGNFFNRTGTTFTSSQLVDFTCGALPTLLSANVQLSALLGRAEASSL